MAFQQLMPRQFYYWRVILFFRNLSPSVKRTEVVEMNLGPKWSADILWGDLAYTRLPLLWINASNPAEYLMVISLSWWHSKIPISSLKDQRLSELTPAVQLNCVVLQAPVYNLKLRYSLTVPALCCCCCVRKMHSFRFQWSFLWSTGGESVAG